MAAFAVQAVHQMEIAHHPRHRGHKFRRCFTQIAQQGQVRREAVLPPASEPHLRQRPMDRGMQRIGAEHAFVSQ